VIGIQREKSSANVVSVSYSYSSFDVQYTYPGFLDWPKAETRFRPTKFISDDAVLNFKIGNTAKCRTP
jgi:hypothetical protein